MSLSSGREVGVSNDRTDEEAVCGDVSLNVGNIETSGKRIREIDGRGGLRRQTLSASLSPSRFSESMHSRSRSRRRLKSRPSNWHS